MMKKLTGQIATRTLSGHLIQPTGKSKTDSDHYTITISGYEFVSVAVETIETESEEKE